MSAKAVGNKARSSKEKKLREDEADSAAAPEWHFLNHQHPEERHSFKRAVRSHVTRVQHASSRRKQFQKIVAESPVASDKQASLPISTENPSKSDVDGSGQGGEGQKKRIRPKKTSGHSRMTAQVAIAKCDPFTAYDPAADWHDDVPGILYHYLGSARHFLQSKGFHEESGLLRADLIMPELYVDSSLFNALITLTTTRIGVMYAEARSEQLNAWLRNNYILIIRAAIEWGVEDRKTVAVGLALLIGWEMEFGEEETCRIHSNALVRLLGSDNFHSKTDRFSYPDRNERNVFRGGTRFSPGFDFYAKQHLLPRRLLFLVNSLNYFDPVVVGARRWMQELFASIGACVPVETTARSTLAQRPLASRIAQLVRQAGYMLASFMRFSANEPPAAQPLTDGLRASHSATLGNDWDSLIGSVYDEILLWSLCAFCASSDVLAEEHLLAVSKLLRRLDIGRVDQLRALLGSFICPPCIYMRVTKLWAGAQSIRALSLVDFQPNQRLTN